MHQPFSNGSRIELNRVAPNVQHKNQEEPSMGQQGRETPDALKSFVVMTYRNAPKLTQRQIADRMAAEFGDDARIDQSTVGRILIRTGARPSRDLPEPKTPPEGSHSPVKKLGPHESDPHQEDLLAGSAAPLGIRTGGCKVLFRAVGWNSGPIASSLGGTPAGLFRYPLGSTSSIYERT